MRDSACQLHSVNATALLSRPLIAEVTWLSTVRYPACKLEPKAISHQLQDLVVSHIVSV